MVLVALRRQEVCVALRALTGYFSYINTELFLTLFLKKKSFSPPVEMMTSQIMVPIMGNVMGIYTLTPSSYLPFLRCFLPRSFYCMSEKS